jgi:predicted RNA-binding protein with PUA-like domain
MSKDKRKWLFKSEPEHFSLQHLIDSPLMISPWDGVRNYQARNLLRDEVAAGDLAFFYHSSTHEKGIAGLCEIVRGGYPDPSACDTHSPYFDPKSRPDTPTWYAVDVRFVRAFSRVILLSELKANAETSGMMVCRRGMRLSIQPVSDREWKAVIEMADAMKNNAETFIHHIVSLG